jgi:thymidylate synthase
MLSPGINDMSEFTMGDIVLHNYQHHGQIKAEMAV